MVQEQMINQPTKTQNVTPSLWNLPLKLIDVFQKKKKSKTPNIPKVTPNSGSRKSQLSNHYQISAKWGKREQNKGAK